MSEEDFDQEDSFLSYPHDMRKLIESIAWKDVVGEIDDMLDDIHLNMENCKNRVELFRFQGRAQALRAAKMIPEQILLALEEEQERKQIDENDEEEPENA